MKILHVSDIGTQMTGITTVVTRLSKEQMLLGHYVKIASINGYQSMPDIEIDDASDNNSFVNLIEVFKPDIVLFHSLWLFKYIRFAKILKTKSINYAIMLHGAGSHQNMKKGWIKKKVANLLFFNSFLRQAKTVIFLSQAEYNNFESKSVLGCYDIIPNGCDLPLKISLPVDSQPDLVRLTYLGRAQYRHKGIDKLIEALRILSNQTDIKSFHISFYANSNDDDIERLKEDLSSLTSIASYDGAVYGEDKAEVLRKSDLFILTSRYEGMPMGVLEALSHGVPCILTPGTNMADDVADAGAGWKSDFSALSIANTIKEAVTVIYNNRQQYQEAAYKMSKRYDWKVIAKQHVDVLLSCLK